MPLILLDRDGVLNADRPDSVLSPEALVMVPGSAAAVARLGAAGWTVAVVTNQSAIGLGLIDEAMLGHIHDKLRAAVAAAGGCIDEIFYSTAPPGSDSPMRKPRPGMIEAALKKFAAAAADTPLIGDALRDLEAAAAAGCPRLLVRTGKGAATEAAGLPPSVRPVAVHDDLAAAVTAVLRDRR